MLSFAGSGATTIHAGSSYWRSDGSSSITRISVSTLARRSVDIDYYILLYIMISVDFLMNKLVLMNGSGNLFIRPC